MPADGFRDATQPSATADESAKDAAAPAEPAAEVAAEAEAAPTDKAAAKAAPAADAGGEGVSMEAAKGVEAGAEAPPGEEAAAESGAADAHAEMAAADAAAPAPGSASGGQGKADPPVKIGYQTFASGSDAFAYYHGIIQNITRNQDLNEVCGTLASEPEYALLGCTAPHGVQRRACLSTVHQRSVNLKASTSACWPAGGRTLSPSRL